MIIFSSQDLWDTIIADLFTNDLEQVTHDHGTLRSSSPSKVCCLLCCMSMLTWSALFQSHKCSIIYLKGTIPIKHKTFVYHLYNVNGYPNKHKTLVLQHWPNVFYASLKLFFVKKVWSTVKIRGTRVPQNAIVPVGMPRPYSIRF